MFVQEHGGQGRVSRQADDGLAALARRMSGTVTFFHSL